MEVVIKYVEFAVPYMSNRKIEGTGLYMKMTGYFISNQGWSWTLLVYTCTYLIFQLSQLGDPGEANLTTSAAPAAFSSRSFSSQQPLPMAKTTHTDATLSEGMVQPTNQTTRSCILANTHPGVQPLPSSEQIHASGITPQQSQPVIPRFATKIQTTVCWEETHTHTA